MTHRRSCTARGPKPRLRHATFGHNVTSPRSAVRAASARCASGVDVESGLRASTVAVGRGAYRYLAASWSLSLLLVLAGCWTNSTTAPQSPTEPSPTRAASSPPPRAPEPSSQEKMLHALGDFADQMCACTDVACAQQVADDMTAFSAEVARSTPTDDSYQLDDEQARRMAEVGTRMGECMQRALMPPSGQPAPSP